jgi:drug/metabolite transporter (DMT)-like permease
MAYLLLFVHVFASAGYNLILRSSLNKKIDPWFLATVMQTGIAIPALFILPFYRPDLTTYSTGIIVQISIIVLLIILFYLSSVNSLKYLEASVFTIIYNFRIVLATLLGILFLGEDILPLQIIGGLLIFVAIITVKQKGSKALTLLGIYWAVFAALAISFLTFSEKDLLSKVNYFDYAIPVTITTTVLMWAFLLPRKNKTDWHLFKDKRIIQLMILRAVSAYGFSLALYAGALLSVATYLSSLSVIVIVALGVIVLKETDYLKAKVIATSIATIGLTLVFIAQLIK